MDVHEFINENGDNRGEDVSKNDVKGILYVTI